MLRPPAACSNASCAPGPGAGLADPDRAREGLGHILPRLADAVRQELGGLWPDAEVAGQIRAQATRRAGRAEVDGDRPLSKRNPRALFHRAINLSVGMTLNLYSVVGAMLFASVA